MATELLNQRLKDVMCMRSQSGFPDPTPTLVDIERTHILFVNAHFKPFVALAYEYNRVRSNAGSATFNTQVTFSIPQFGDFFADMVVNTTLEATSATQGVVPPLPAFIGTDFQSLTATASVSGTNNAAAGIYTQYTHQYTDLAGEVLSVGAAAANFVRYAEYPGERLFRRVKFEVNGNPLDEYTAEAVFFYRKFRIGDWKLTGWKRLVGQEVPQEAYTDLLTISGQSIFPAPATDLTDVAGIAAAGGAVSASVNTRELVHIVSGAQTPKAQQPELDLWVPLLRDASHRFGSASSCFATNRPHTEFSTHLKIRGKQYRRQNTTLSFKACASACAA